MFRKTTDKLVTQPCDIRWLNRASSLSQTDAHQLLAKVIKDNNKTYHLLRTFGNWTAEHVRLVFEAGYEHYIIQLIHPLATGAVLAPDVIDAILREDDDFLGLISLFANNIKPTLEQIVTLLGRGSTTLLPLWLKDNSLEALWQHLIRNDHVSAARMLHKVHPQVIRNIDISNVGNNGQWDMARFFVEAIPETDELTLILLVKFIKPKLLKIAWDKAPAECRKHTINWLWYDENHSHRTSILQVPLKGIPPQREIVLESVDLSDRRFVQHFLNEGWAIPRERTS